MTTAALISLIGAPLLWGIAMWFGMWVERRKHDARLIAAAPELLKACQDALFDYNQYVPSAQSVREILKAAIAKVKP